MKMEAPMSPETSVTIYKSARHQLRRYCMKWRSVQDSCPRYTTCGNVCSDFCVM